MSKWSRYLAKAVSKADDGLDKVRYKLVGRFGKDVLVALPYLTYGTREKLYIKGRVLEARNIQPAREDASFWENFKNAYKRFESDEAPLARLRLRFGELTKEVRADEEGYFQTWLELPEPLPETHAYTQQVDVELLAPLRGEGETQFTATVVVPSSDADFGIISDMDDTVLQTGATSILGMAKKTLFGNARTRLPFSGVDAFYSALHREINPIFYVSSSPWNLYDVLVEFLDVNDIPAGPMMLRDWGSSPTELLPTSHSTHKLDVIKQILMTYPELPFILIGDSGQEDPEIYREIVHDHPGRILSIYIRDVSENAERDQKVQALADEVAKDRSELLLIPNTVAAARHAASKGFIPSDTISAVERAKLENEREPGV